MKKKDLIKKWLNNEQLTRLELEAFEKLDVSGSYLKISETAKKFSAPPYDMEENLMELNNELSNRPLREAKKSYLPVLLRIAAIFVIAIGTYFAFFNNHTISVQTLASQKTTVALPDHSIVEINALSSVEYSEKDWSSNRVLTLKGEAYFKVAKGQRFDVTTSAGIISVLGTQFNVKQRDNYFEVICYEGSVSVTYDDIINTLTPGKVVRVIDGVLDTHATTSFVPDWTENQSSFVSTPYQYVLDEFERQYGVTIISKNIDQTILFTGNFVHSDIQNAIRSIAIPMRLNYEIKENNITLTKD